MTINELLIIKLALSHINFNELELESVKKAKTIINREINLKHIESSFDYK